MFKIDDRVNRKEQRDVVGATVIDVDANNDQVCYLIEYDEGGQGWWPEDALVAQ